MRGRRRDTETTTPLNLGEIFAGALAERASLDLAKGNKASARNKLAEALNAHSNHLEATLGYGKLLLKSFQPLFEQSNAVQAAILPPIGGAFYRLRHR